MRVKIEKSKDGKWLKYETDHTWRYLDISGLSSDDIRDIIDALEKEIYPEGGWVPNVQTSSSS